MPLSPKDAPALTPLDGYHAWRPRLSIGISPGVRGGPKEDIHFSLTLMWVPTHQCVPMLLWAHGDGALMGW